MTTSNVIAGRDLGPLRIAVTGDVFTRGDRGYDEARRVQNLTTDERPAVVVVARTQAMKPGVLVVMGGPLGADPGLMRPSSAGQRSLFCLAGPCRDGPGR